MNLDSDLDLVVAEVDVVPVDEVDGEVALVDSLVVEVGLEGLNRGRLLLREFLNEGLRLGEGLFSPSFFSSFFFSRSALIRLLMRA